jgi:iron complex outermembrane receptor protein
VRFDLYLCASVLSAAAAILAPAQAASAQSGAAPANAVGQETTAETGEGLDAIVVTARRREENQQSVPVSITALSGDTVAAKGVTNLIELSRQVPNVIVAGGSTNPQSFTVGIRGVRTKDTFIVYDPAVATVYGEQVIAHPYGFGEALFDIGSVQVLKGPQGTLFGRNTTAGAIVVEPNYASIDEGFHGSVKASIGSYGLQQYNAVLNVPLGESMAIRVAGEHRERNGYMRNLLTGDRWNSTNNDAFRVSLLIEPSDDFRSITTLDYLTQHSSPSAPIAVAMIPGGSYNFQGGAANAAQLLAEQRRRGPYKFASSVGSNGPTDLLRPARCLPPSIQPDCRAADIDDMVRLRSWNVINNSVLDLGDVSLKNILSYRHVTRESFQATWNNDAVGFAGSPGNLSVQGSPGFEQLTEELQLSGKAFADRLDWTVGLFYLREDGREVSSSFQGLGFTLPASQNYTVFDFDHRSIAGFTQGTFAVTDRLNVTAGARYTRDHRKATIRPQAYNLTTSVITCNIFQGTTNVRLPAGPDCQLNGNKKWNAVTWTVAADYKITPDAMVYASVSRGYRSGGFFPRATRESQLNFDPEYMLSYEVGAKVEWDLFARPIRTNLAVYRMDNTDKQVLVQDLTTSPISGATNNAGKARYQGFEFETVYRPADALEFTGFASYTDFEYLEYFDGISDLSWQTAEVPLTHWSLGASTTYTIPLGGESELRLRGDVSWFSKAVVNNTTAPNVKSDIPQGDYAIVNARADWARPLGLPVDLGVWVTNLTKKWYSLGNSCLGGFCYSVISPPRMFGFDLTYRFGDDR